MLIVHSLIVQQSRIQLKNLALEEKVNKLYDSRVQTCEIGRNVQDTMLNENEFQNIKYSTLATYRKGTFWK